jgi:hypothetical protein
MYESNISQNTGGNNSEPRSDGSRLHHLSSRLLIEITRVSKVPGKSGEDTRISFHTPKGILSFSMSELLSQSKARAKLAGFSGKLPPKCAPKDWDCLVQAGLHAAEADWEEQRKTWVGW